MKTLELKIKKDVLIVENEFENKIDFIENELGAFYFLCKGSELTEEIASELVNETLMYEKHKVKCYRYRSYKEGFVGFDNAIESFISAVESKGFHWLDNPIEKPKYYDKILTKNCLIWQEAEEKTFRNPLIFVKNENTRRNKK